MSDRIAERHYPVDQTAIPDDRETECWWCATPWPCDAITEHRRAEAAEHAMKVAGFEQGRLVREREQYRAHADALAHAVEWALEADAYDPPNRWQKQARAALAAYREAVSEPSPAAPGMRNITVARTPPDYGALPPLCPVCSGLGCGDCCGTGVVPRRDPDRGVYGEPGDD